ncbi:MULTISPECIES: sensor histidine kinase [Sutcliffiella]|uniref:histidine kinase n=1 Tax=Sutcliffiella cohnii TaxID=33932 RepID=A0A223KLT3_9BACI|nr:MULTISPECIES: sensor histidine kinase [Sutcliffiella]AST90469.1 two-component sensor histidine kinase [Sutcliffiella cohnii]WBL16121.1 sensor histidine kinase [Sutcliffiella sp. NC1]
MAKGRRVIEIFPKKYGFFPYVFLIYLCLPAFYVYQEEGWKAITGWIALLLFLLTYRQLYVTQKYFHVWLALQMLIILYLSIFFDIYNIFLGFFTANFIGWYTKKNSFFTALAAFIITLVIPLVIYIFNNDTFYHLVFFVPFLIIMLMSPIGVRSMNSRMELERQLDEANQQIKELVKREERMRIARDLHDTLGHTLSLLTLKSQLISKLALKDGEKASIQAKEMERISRSALSQVRELVSEMRTVTIAEELLEAQTLLETANIQLTIIGETSVKEVPHLTQNILSLCIREAMTNIVKHSKATNCSINIVKNAGEVNITIEDNGVGMKEQQTGGNGLKGIEERLELIDGCLSFSSNKGVKLNITVPIILKEREDNAS